MFVDDGEEDKMDKESFQVRAIIPRLTLCLSLSLLKGGYNEFISTCSVINTGYIATKV